MAPGSRTGCPVTSPIKFILLHSRMSIPTPITFVVAVNDDEIFESNFKASPCFQGDHPYQILMQRDFTSATKAYNDAIDRSVNDLIVFAHQDVVFPGRWPWFLERSLQSLRQTDPEWGVLGCYGETLNDSGRGYVYSPGRGILGEQFDQPALVQTLDELVLILRKSHGLRFDAELPHFHFYGADICMAAAEKGKKSYAICALCIHNSQQNLVLPREFYAGYRHIKRRWRKFLPIQTTCARITNSDFYMYQKRLLEFYLRHVRRNEIGATRVEDGGKLLAQLEALHPEMASVTREPNRCLCQ
jgi:hypothetical protein